jgi:hypothetical protein
MIYEELCDEFDFAMFIWMPPDGTVDANLETIKMGIEDLLIPADQRVPGDQPMDSTDKIRHYLAGKRYLLMLGGITSKTKLNCVRASLPDEKNGSRVLLVLDIENEEVALHANFMNQEPGFNGIHRLSRLDEERSGHLFRSRAFRRDETDSSFNDASRYNKIVYDITGGYPLAIVLLAGLLRFKERPGQWEAVLQQLRPGSRVEEATLVQQGGDGEGDKQITTEVVQSTSHADLVSTRITTIERVFWASFEDLPNDLKSCFLDFSAFPKTTSSYATDIVLRWIAEGFIKPHKGKTMEEVGHKYLKELVLRFLVRIDETCVDADGINKVSVHTRLHEFLQSEARESGFMELHDMHHVFVPPSARRLAFTSFGGRYTPFANKFPKLRSFTCCLVQEEKQHQQSSQDTNTKHGHDLKFLCGSKFLRLISIQDLRIDKLPNRVGDMVHLRYLGVPNSKDLKELPSSIKRLFNLQTLDISGTQIETIDPGFWKIRTLRHVFAEKLTLPETIPEELAELQTLTGVKPAAQGAEWKEQNCPLHKMPNLRTLCLHGIQHEKHGSALKSALVKMHLLRHLNLRGDAIPSCTFTAPSLRFLEVLKLDGAITEWPEVGWDASKFRPNLISIDVRHSDVPQHMVEELIKNKRMHHG